MDDWLTAKICDLAWEDWAYELKIHLFVLRYIISINIQFKVLKLCKSPVKCCINGGNFIRLLFLSTKLFKFEY